MWFSEKKNSQIFLFFAGIRSNVLDHPRYWLSHLIAASQKMFMKFSPLRLWKVPTESSISSLRSHLLFLSFPFQVLTILLIKVANKKRFERKVRQRSINVRFANTRKFPLGIVHKWRHGRKGVMHFLTAVLRP